MAAETQQHGLVVVSKETFTLTTTVDTLADVGVFSCRMLRTKNMQFSAATNTLSVQVLGSVDGGVTFPVVVEAEFALSVAASPMVKVSTAFYSHLKVRVRPNAAGVHGTLTAIMDAASF